MLWLPNLVLYLIVTGLLFGGLLLLTAAVGLSMNASRRRSAGGRGD